MKLKTLFIPILAICALIFMTVPALAGLDASFSQSMTGYGYVPGASQASYNSLSVGSLGFDGMQSAGMYVVDGYANTANGSAISVGGGGLVVTGGAYTNVASGWCGISAAGAGTSTNTWTPGLYINTNDNTSAMTSGNGSANAGSSSVVVIYRPPMR